MNEIDVSHIKSNISITRYLKDQGVELLRSGTELKCKCPIPSHKDDTPSFFINERENVFYCHGCHAKGSIIDLVVAIECCTVGDAIKKLHEYMGGSTELPKVSVTESSPDPEPNEKPLLDSEYIYTDANGNKRFFVKRFMYSNGKKTFRQGHYNAQGGEIMSMKGVERLPYNLPEVMKSDLVWLSEGEKCAEALKSVGLVGTCTAGGSGNWLDSYAMYFADKDVVILPDYDEAGENYAKSASESLKDVARSVRVLNLGMSGLEKGYDVADFIESMSQSDASEIKSELFRRMEDIIPVVKGFELNISSINDMERMYMSSRQRLSGKSLNLGDHINSLNGVVRELRTGDCICLKGPTGSAKTMFAQNIARWARPLNVLIFEPELAREEMFERWVAMEMEEEMDNVYDRMSRVGDIKTEGLDHVYVCPYTRPTPNYIEETINRSELVIGARPDIVIVDYIQLVHADGKCNRYERFSNVAEAFRVIPNNTRTIFIFISQVHRPDPKSRQSQEPSRFDAKESGSIENSATLMLDIRAGDNSHQKIITVLKDTSSGLEGASAPVGFVGEKGLFCNPFASMVDVF